MKIFKDDDCIEIKSAKIVGVLGIIAAIVSAFIAGGLNIINTEETSSQASLSNQVTVNAGNQPVVAFGHAEGDVSIQMSKQATSDFELEFPSQATYLGSIQKLGIYATDIEDDSTIKCEWVFDEKAPFTFEPAPEATAQNNCQLLIKAPYIPPKTEYIDAGMFEDLFVPFSVTIYKDGKAIKRYKEKMYYMNGYAPFLLRDKKIITADEPMNVEVFASKAKNKIPDELECSWSNWDNYVRIEKVTENGCVVKLFPNLNQDGFLMVDEYMQKRVKAKSQTLSVSILHDYENIGMNELSFRIDPKIKMVDPRAQTNNRFQ